MPRDVSPELRRALKHLRLGRLEPLLPERLRLARERNIDPAEFLLLLLSDEVQRRANQRHAMRAKKASGESSSVGLVQSPHVVVRLPVAKEPVT